MTTDRTLRIPVECKHCGAYIWKSGYRRCPTSGSPVHAGCFCDTATSSHCPEGC